MLKKKSDAKAHCGVAVFDLDGTVTKGDTLLPYAARFLASRPRRWLLLWRLPVGLLAYAIGRLDRDALKQWVIQTCFARARRDEVTQCTAEFVERLCRRGVRSDALSAIAMHRARGDQLVLLSASTDLYVPEVAARLGMNDCICTELRWYGEQLDGRFVTVNRRGAEKARILSDIRKRFDGHLTAYGNSRTDFAHLRLADTGILINGSRWIRYEASRMGLVVLHWN